MDSSTHIYLLRHGETQGGSRYNGSTDVALSERGWSQMQATVETEDCWDRVISSPLSRCAHFAQSLQKQNNIPLQLDERIREIHFGVWEGKTAAEVFETDGDALTRYWQDPVQHTPIEGEALKDFEARVLSFWQEVIARYHGEKILLIAHGGVIRLLLCHILQRPLQRIFDFEVVHASLHHIRVEHTLQNTTHTAFIETAIDDIIEREK